MKHRAHTGPRLNIPAIGFAIASLILACAPIVWLINTWQDPSYQSTGAVYALFVIALIAWSASSKKTGSKSRPQIGAVVLLVLSALLRLASQVLAINILGGIALALDVFAVVSLLGLAQRSRPLSALWVSVLFLFSLPFERIAQRVLGFPMQEISAFGSCKMLGVIFDDLNCFGLRLQVRGQDVLVDLPCSGTQSLMLSLAVFVGLSALYRPRLFQAAIWGVATIALSIIGNALRITLLAIGIVNQHQTGIDVMAWPGHDLVGYGTIALTLFPLFWCYRSDRQPGGRTCVTRLPQVVPRLRGWTAALASTGFVALALIIVMLPRQAVDVSRHLARLELPQSLSGSPRQIRPLTSIEGAYFSQYGGTAQKAVYGPMALTVVQTTSPIRHLHSPSDCLRGLGYAVEFVGSQFDPTPTAIYRATAKDGSAWRVAVTFISDQGSATSNVAEAIWHWLKNPGSEWLSVQRITPWLLDDPTRQSYELAAIAALDLPPMRP